jgi:c(7)-type cytochrome triheme protein
MKRFFMAGVVATGIAMTAVGGLAASMQDLIYQGTTANDMAIFHGKKHLERGIKCAECHNKDVFPEKKFGSVKITMKTIAQGKHCGVCHNGKRAFGVTGNCNRCHPIKSGDMVIYD